MLAAYEVTLEQGSKDEAAWNRLRGQLYAEPDAVRRQRMADRRTDAGRHPPVGLSLDSVEAMLSAAAARDAQYGAA